MRKKILTVSLALVLLTVMGAGACGGGEVTQPPGEEEEAEQVYRDLSVGPMTVSIPYDWQRTDKYAEYVEELRARFTAEERQALQVDMYEDKSEDAFMMIVTIDMAEIYESSGSPWPGWDIMLEEMGLTAGEFAEMAQYSAVFIFTDLSRETHRQLMIGGHEAWEMMYTAKDEGELVQVCVLIIFALDDVGIMLMAVKQDKWGKFEEVWEEIRDSVRT